jgi:phosphoglycerol transferase MdoB-like AlkP superfamily enzyme
VTGLVRLKPTPSFTMSYPFISQVFLLIKRLMLLLVLYQFCRLAFLIANFPYFETASTVDVAGAFLFGFRFDLMAILTSNALIVLLHLVPHRIFYHSIYQKSITILFFLINIPLLLLNTIDLEYFKYQGKRTTADLFQLFTMGDDMKNTLPKMMIDFWYVIVVFSVLVWLMSYLYRRTHIKTRDQKINYKTGWREWVTLILVLALFFVGARGGFQLKPLGIMAAARLTSPQLVPLTLNTPFTVIRTLGKSVSDERRYLDDSTALGYFNKTHHFHHQEPFRKLNVVIIVLESFGSEYIGYFNNGRGYTPFLDSLMAQGLTYTNAYANAKKSIDGIPAVIASIPSLLPVSYISSPYIGNNIESIASILAKKGYTSAFFHGGNNGTMNFDNFTSLAGFDHYFGRKEFPGNSYDGHWGVYDEDFYKFFINQCNNFKEPFVSVFFSLSSHHPYSIPDHLRGKFPKGELPIHESIGYADYALSEFFNEARKTKWFDETLFVITADHTGPASQAKYNTRSGMFRIPVLFYHPAEDLKGIVNNPVQQTDIIPGILDYLRYDQPFVAFGKSLISQPETPFAINYPGDVFQVIGSEILIHFDGSERIGAYAYQTDTLLMNNLLNPSDPDQQELENIFKSFYQQFNHSIIHNRMTTNKNHQ